MTSEYPDSTYKTAYFLDKDLNIYTTPLHNRREAVLFSGDHNLEFIGFLKNPADAAEIVKGSKMDEAEKKEKQRTAFRDFFQQAAEE